MCEKPFARDLAQAREMLTAAEAAGVVHALGAELSVSTRHAAVPEAVLALAERSGDDAASRADEPYRRALSGVYARLAATHLKLTGKPAPRPGPMSGEPYPDPAAFRADPEVQEALAAARVPELARPTLGDGETYEDLLADLGAALDR